MKAADYPIVEAKGEGLLLRMEVPAEWNPEVRKLLHTTLTVEEAASLLLQLMRLFGPGEDACISYPTGGPVELIGFRNVFENKLVPEEPFVPSGPVGWLDSRTMPPAFRMVEIEEKDEEQT
jgi:hypothetical protein